MVRRYQTSIPMNEEEYILIQALKKDKITVMDIFRKGLEFYAPKVPMELVEDTKKKVREELGKMK